MERVERRGAKLLGGFTLSQDWFGLPEFFFYISFPFFLWNGEVVALGDVALWDCYTVTASRKEMESLEFLGRGKSAVGVVA